MSSIVKRRRLEFAGHCRHSRGEQYHPVSDVIFASRAHRFRIGQANRTTYLKTLINDTSLDSKALAHIALDREAWKAFLDEVC